MKRCVVCGELPRDDHCLHCHRAHDYTARTVSVQFSSLRKARRDQGLTVDELAQTIGVSDSALRTWERGQWLPRPLNYYKWIEALDAQG